MKCPNCDLSGWHVEAADDHYRVVNPNGTLWAIVKKSYMGGAQERAHWTAEALAECEKRGGLRP